MVFCLNQSMTQSHTNVTSSSPPAAKAQALWYVAPGRCELRSEQLGQISGEAVRIRTEASAVSRGTEWLVCSGLVPECEWQRMRAPLQEGDFPFPVKYGYACAGRVERGAGELVGSRVFCLHPHQTVFDIPAKHVVQIPSGIPSTRATLAANLETALNALWDGLPSPGDHICVVGGGILGLLTGYLAARIPATRVTLVDTNAERKADAAAMGCEFALPEMAPQNQDLVFHASASAEGLQTAFKAAGNGATVVEISWYGNKEIPTVLGADFHSRRLILKSSQVGAIRPDRQDRWTFKRRLETALSLLDDPVLDRLVARRIAFQNAAEQLPLLLNSAEGLAPILTYE